MKRGWIVDVEPSRESIVMSTSYSMVVHFNHLANCNYEAVTEVYFFLKRSTIQKPSHGMPKHTKKKGTMLAANASMVTLSISFGQLQCNPVIEMIINALQAICRGHPLVLCLCHQVIVHAQSMLHINLIHNRSTDYLAALQQLHRIICSKVICNCIDLMQDLLLN